MRSDDLICCCRVFNSDDDQPVVADLSAGYDSSLNLIILLEHIDYDSPEHDRAIYASIKKDDAAMLARRLKVSMTGLPLFIAESISYFDEIINPTLGQVRDCFREILRCLDYEKCRYRIYEAGNRRCR